MRSDFLDRFACLNIQTFFLKELAYVYQLGSQCLVFIFVTTDCLAVLHSGPYGSPLVTELLHFVSLFVPLILRPHDRDHLALLFFYERGRLMALAVIRAFTAHCELNRRI